MGGGDGALRGESEAGRMADCFGACVRASFGARACGNDARRKSGIIVVARK